MGPTVMRCERFAVYDIDEMAVGEDLPDVQYRPASKIR